MSSTEDTRSKSFKDQWARYVARRALEHDLAKARDRVMEATSSETADKLKLPALKIDGKESVGQLLSKTEEFTGLGFVPPEPGKFKIGIVGAGVSGLFSAMVFDYLNKNIKGLEIDYDIIEAAGEKRLGGRLYTHEFGPEAHDYYDVGAMRFPDNQIMKRTFQLFELLGLREGKGGLIPYYYADDENNLSYFNDIQIVGKAWEKGLCDPFKIDDNKHLPEEERIPAEFLNVDPSKLVKDALKGFTEKTKELFNNARAEAKERGNQDTGPEGTKLWKHLMKADHMSVRQFFLSKENGPDMTEGPKWNFNTIAWLETVTYGTGWYDQALSECVFEELDFDTPEQVKGEPKRNYWFCIDGGTQRVARLMAEKINKPVQLNSQVLAINANADNNKRLDPKVYVPITLDIKQTNPIDKTVNQRKEDYFAVFNSTTLPALQRMDLKNAGLLWGTKQAIRALGYGASCKVGIKFNSPWWQLPPFNMTKGGVSRTDLPLRVCVYPSYNIPEAEGKDWDPKKPSVLLCSYTWGQDAQRLGSLISPNTPKDEEQLKSVLLHNLALMHAKPDEGWPYEKLLAHLIGEYATHHAWDWHRDQNMSGAFAFFGPGQFSNMFEEIIKPNAFGQLYLVGEAASSHHAWIVGALESVIRAVYVMFDGLNSYNPEFQPYLDVMDLLSKQTPETGEPLTRGLPFYPLPEEMPERQYRTKPGTVLTGDPTNQNKALRYTSAVAGLSLVESYFELVYNKAAV